MKATRNRNRRFPVREEQDLLAENDEHCEGAYTISKLTCVIVAFLALSTHDVDVSHIVSMDEPGKVVVHGLFL